VQYKIIAIAAIFADYYRRRRKNNQFSPAFFTKIANFRFRHHHPDGQLLQIYIRTLSCITKKEWDVLVSGILLVINRKERAENGFASVSPSLFTN